MIRQKPDQETFLEAGLIALGVMLIVGLWVLLSGKMVGRLQRSRRHAEGPPSRGTVPSQRHRNVSTVATR